MGMYNYNYVTVCAHNYSTVTVYTSNYNYVIMQRKKAKYSLKSFTCHHGDSVSSGHYTAYVKSKSQWFHMNDSSVRQKYNYANEE